MEPDVIVKMEIPEGSIRRRREAMEAMIEAGKAMILAHGNTGILPLPEAYNLMAIQVHEFIEWRKNLTFKHEPRSPEELF